MASPCDGQGRPSALSPTGNVDESWLDITDESSVCGEWLRISGVVG